VFIERSSVGLYVQARAVVATAIDGVTDELFQYPTDPRARRPRPATIRARSLGTRAVLCLQRGLPCRAQPATGASTRSGFSISGSTLEALKLLDRLTEAFDHKYQFVYRP